MPWGLTNVFRAKPGYRYVGCDIHADWTIANSCEFINCRFFHRFDGIHLDGPGHVLIKDSFLQIEDDTNAKAYIYSCPTKSGSCTLDGIHGTGIGQARGATLARKSAKPIGLTFKEDGQIGVAYSDGGVFWPSTTERNIQMAMEMIG